MVPQVWKRWQGVGKMIWVSPPSNHIQERESQGEVFCWTVWYLSNQRRDLLDTHMAAIARVHVEMEMVKFKRTELEI